jgi:hypothetical protein
MAALWCLAAKAGGRTMFLEAFGLKQVYVPLRAYSGAKLKSKG